jgi:hypothetical protein
MSDQQVLLQGANWKKQLLIFVLLIVIGLVILRIWRPGTISAFLGYVADCFVYVFNYVGNFISSLQDRF